jgi:hypothetical protein
MAINLKVSNLYSTGYLVEVENSNQILKRAKVVYESSSVNDRIHVILQGERIWQISFDYYKSANWWWVISDVNNIENVLDLPVGTEILIPDLDLIKTLI